MPTNNIYNQVLSLQSIPNVGFSYINANQGITISSGQQFFIDNVYTGFFPPVPAGSTDKNKYRKQKWLSIGLEGNSFRRYINENSGLQGIPSGLEPGNFVYFTIEPKSSLLESGLNTDSNNARYISSLRAKPYMVIENDGNRPNSYEKTPSNLFTGVSGNNNFVVFHPQSRYKNLALQSVRFHPIIGNGYSEYNLWSGVPITVQPKNHHLETFIKLNIKSGANINYGNSTKNLSFAGQFQQIASGDVLIVSGSSYSEANGMYVYKSSNNYINENNYRIYNSGNTNRWVLAQPKNTGVSYTISPDSINFNSIYKTTSVTSYAYTHKIYANPKRQDINPYYAYNYFNWTGVTGNSSIRVSQGCTDASIYPYYSSIGLLYSNNSSWNGFNTTTNKPTGAYITSKNSISSLPISKINQYSKFTINSYNWSPIANGVNPNIKLYYPYIIFDNQGLDVFPYTYSTTMPNELIIKEKVNFKRALSPNLHQGKKVNMKFNYENDTRTVQEQLVIRNFYPVLEKIYSGYSKNIEFYDERDNGAYDSNPFYVLSGKDYSFEQNELFIYKSRPDFNSPTNQSVIKW
jgi:hypothetical protein